MAVRNYKYKLYVGKHTRQLSRLITSTNFAWNHVVMLARRFYKLYGVGISPTRLQQHMAKLAKTDQYWSTLHSQSMQHICQKYAAALDMSLKNKRRGFPRVHKKHIGGSVLFKGKGGYQLYADGIHGTLIINKLGKTHRFKFKVTRQWGDVKNITVKRDNDGCIYLIVCCDVPIIRAKREDSGSIGIDFGMKTFLTLSDGSSYHIPDYHRQALRKTRLADRSYALKRNARVFGSSFRRVKKHKQKQHRKVLNLRSEFHWKLAHTLCRKYDFIAFETLSMEGMKRHRNWGRKVSSLGFGEFVQKLHVVAEKYGTTVHHIDKWYASSQTCSNCGYVYKGTKDLSVREWKCPICGMLHDRDVNAARNILSVALQEIKGKDVSLVVSSSKTKEELSSKAAAMGGFPPETD